MATRKRRTVKKKNTKVAPGALIMSGGSKDWNKTSGKKTKAKTKIKYNKDGSIKKGKVVYRDAKGKKVKEKVKYHKDGTDKKATMVKDGKRRTTKYYDHETMIKKRTMVKKADKNLRKKIKRRKSTNRDTPLPKSDW